MPETLSIDGFGPLPVHRPTTVADVGHLVRQQRAAKQGVYPVGGRTQLDFGLVPTKPGVAVDLTALSKVIDYPARDMTITVEAGITLAELQAVLATEGQWLPLDAPYPERSTLGGLVATNTSGPRRLGYGTLRDFVIGISFINDNGDEIKGGGRVVKNVAGYDLMKLHTGALGTLGVITQLTLKVRPKPEATRVVHFGVPDDHIYDVIECVRKSSCCPVAFHASYRDAWIFALGFEEKRTTIDWQLSTLRNDLSEFHLDITESLDSGFWYSVLPLTVDVSSNYITTVSIKPSELKSLVNRISGAAIHAEPLNGIVRVLNDKPIELPESNAVIHRAPAAWKTPERVFGKPTPAFELMRHIKRTLDPDDIFNPGRMFV